MPDDGDLDTPVLRARANRLGRALEPSELAELGRAVAASEATYGPLRARPIGLLSGRTDHALGDAWLRSAARATPSHRRSSDGDD